MGADVFEILINFTKLIAIFLLMVQLVPMLVWVERRGSAYIQNRFGPNRVGPLGLTQLLADAVKFMFKEEFLPEKSRAAIFYLAPVVSLIPGALAFAAIPLAMPVIWDNYRFAFQGYEVGIGIVFVLGVSSLGSYSLLMAGWGSSNKFSLLGALRACAQMISYELALGLAIVGILLLYGTFDFRVIIDAQSSPMNFHFLGEVYKPALFGMAIPDWGIFYQPLGFVLFFVSVFAEANRLPFDLPEAEAELVAGFHTEYGGLKMNMFYIGEYGHMMVASALLATFYFGGYDIPFVEPEFFTQLFMGWGCSANVASLLTSLTHFASLGFKILIFLWIFVWVRWTLPRFRYDQLMDLGWKTMLPWALANTILTAILIYVMRLSWS